VASCFPYRMFSRIVVWKSTGSCATSPIFLSPQVVHHKRTLEQELCSTKRSSVDRSARDGTVGCATILPTLISHRQLLCCISLCCRNREVICAVSISFLVDGIL
jgi:hypothetical protein